MTAPRRAPIISSTTTEKGRIPMAKNDRFQVIQTEGNGLTAPQRIILLDTATGVQYLFASSGNAGGLCPLVDRDGKPMTWDT